MASGKACRAWVKMVRPFEIDMIAPQHGAIFAGENADKFLSWFEKLECGIDRIDALYGERYE
jgi:flavorubredoxin